MTKQDKAREVLLLLNSKYNIINEDFDDGGDCELFIKINQKKSVTESELNEVLKPLNNDGYILHICAIDNMVGVLIETVGVLSV